MTEPRPITQLAEALYAAYNSGDARAAAELYSESGSHREVAQDSTRTGRDAIRQGLEGFLRSFPDARWEADRLIADGDEAAVTYRLTGTLSAPLGPFQPEGQRLDLSGVHILRASDGELTESADYWDAATFARQMRGS